jgi:hypothetical protein
MPSSPVTVTVSVPPAPVPSGLTAESPAQAVTVPVEGGETDNSVFITRVDLDDDWVAALNAFNAVFD